jgi:hypothetical protein
MFPLISPALEHITPLLLVNKRIVRLCGVEK